MDRAITIDDSILIEILRYRQTHEDGEAQNELCSEAVEVAELKEAKTSST